MIEKQDALADPVLDRTAQFLFKCIIITAVFLLVWFFWLMAVSGFGSAYFKAWFGLTQHEFNVLNLAGMTGLKVLGFVFFLVPFIAVKLMLRQTNNANFSLLQQQHQRQGAEGRQGRDHDGGGRQVRV